MTNISDNIRKIVYTYLLLKIITAVPCTSSLRENFLPDVNKDTKMIQQAVDRHILMQCFARMRRNLLLRQFSTLDHLQVHAIDPLYAKRVYRRFEHTVSYIT